MPLKLTSNPWCINIKPLLTLAPHQSQNLASGLLTRWQELHSLSCPEVTGAGGAMSLVWTALAWVGKLFSHNIHVFRLAGLPASNNV